MQGYSGRDHFFELGGHVLVWSEDWLSGAVLPVSGADTRLMRHDYLG